MKHQKRTTSVTLATSMRRANVAGINQTSGIGAQSDGDGDGGTLAMVGTAEKYDSFVS